MPPDWEVDPEVTAADGLTLAAFCSEAIQFFLIPSVMAEKSLVTNSILSCWLLTIQGEKCAFHTGHHGLHQLFSGELRAYRARLGVIGYL